MRNTLQVQDKSVPLRAPGKAYAQPTAIVRLRPRNLIELCQNSVSRSGKCCNALDGKRGWS